MVTAPNQRILVVDDNEAIHEDFAKVLAPRPQAVPALSEIEALLFDRKPELAPATGPTFELTFASQGQEALAKVQAAKDADQPVAMAFVDIRMPPGWDGVETTARLWEVDPRIQVVICSAYSDYSWEQLHEKLGARQQLLILKKPFDPIEVLQMAHALTEKWDLLRDAQQRREDLEAAVKATEKKLLAEVDLRQATEAKLRHEQQLSSLGRLAGGIAHEINNPLAFVFSNLRFVEDVVKELEAPQPLAQELNEATHEAMAGADRIRRIVRDVKIFSKAEAAPLEPVALGRVVERALELAQEEIGDKGKVVIELGDAPTVVGSEEGLVQVFYNLFTNAAQAWPKDRAEANELRIVGAWTDDAASVEVRDNGSGISAEHLEHVFEPFFSTKPIGSGTGLGLCICHGIVNKLGGDLSVRSEVGRGTTFRVSLPVGHPKVAAAAIAAAG